MCKFCEWSYMFGQLCLVVLLAALTGDAFGRLYGGGHVITYVFSLPICYFLAVGVAQTFGKKR